MLTDVFEEGLNVFVFSQNRVMNSYNLVIIYYRRYLDIVNKSLYVSIDWVIFG